MTMVMGPTAPEPATEGKDLAGGFVTLQMTDGTHTHNCKFHVSSFTNSSGSLLYDTPPSGLFSDAGPDVTASALMVLLQTFYLTSYTISVKNMFRMVSGEPVEVWPLPSIASVAGTAAATGGLTQAPAGQLTFSTRDTSGNPFKFVLLSIANWTPNPPQIWNDNSSGNGFEKLAHFLAQNGAVRSHSGNKPVAPFKAIYCLNNRLRREYHQR